MSATPSEHREFGFRTSEHDLSRARERVTSFLKTRVEDADADGVVVSLSGGIDSSTTATLAVDALGSDRVHGLVLPARKADNAGQFDAELVAERLDIMTNTVHLAPLLDAFEDTVAPAISPKVDRLARGNALARLRATTAYYAANTRNVLVCGTTNRTEFLLGYFTKFGDGAADLRPLANLYKTEVRALADYLDVPRHVREKPPSAGLWRDQTDAAELGASYDLIDGLLIRLVEGDSGIEEIASELGMSAERIKRYVDMYVTAQHKRERPPNPSTADEGSSSFYDTE